jgi:preprotein translocase subunit SecG
MYQSTAIMLRRSSSSGAMVSINFGRSGRRMDRSASGSASFHERMSAAMAGLTQGG